jgi:diguanylate cyclase (GGDEF)-like protein
LLLFAYNVTFGIVLDYPAHVLGIHDFFIISANLIGGAAGYLVERQKRVLFLRERELDDERQLHMKRALHDGLTGLPNRDLLYDRISQAMKASKREGVRHCGYFIDLDGFKAVNDRLNHESGDRVLKQIARRLGSSVRAMDTVARIGGDEFFVLASEIDDTKAAGDLAAKLLNQCVLPLEGVPQDIRLSASIGMCLLPYDGMSVSDFIRRADKAMYRVKSEAKNGYALAEEVHGLLDPAS